MLLRVSLFSQAQLSYKLLQQFLFVTLQLIGLKQQTTNMILRTVLSGSTYKHYPPLCSFVLMPKQVMSQISRMAQISAHMRRNLCLKAWTVEAACKRCLTCMPYEGGGPFFEPLNKFIKDVTGWKVLPPQWKFPKSPFSGGFCLLKNQHVRALPRLQPLNQNSASWSKKYK